MTIQTLNLFIHEFLSGKTDQTLIEQYKTQLIEKIEQEYFKTRDDYSLSIIRSFLHIIVTKLFRFKSNKKLILGDRKYLSEFLDFQNLVEKECFETKR